MQLVYCKMCKKELREINGLWKSIKGNVFSEQYCWMDMEKGSALHIPEPVTGILKPYDTVAIDPPQGRYETQAREIEAFELYAKDKGMNLTLHPLHYIYLDDKTQAARDAWRAALWFIQKLDDHNAALVAGTK